jgi:hypothetical protein
MQAKQMPPRLMPNNLADARSSIFLSVFRRRTERAISSGTGVAEAVRVALSGVPAFVGEP